MSKHVTISNVSIRQDEHGLYSLNDLHKAAGNQARHQPSRFIRLDSTQELITEISSYPDLGSSHRVKNGKGTWVCKELVYSYAMWISPAFSLKVIRAYDNLVSEEKPQLPTLPNFSHIRLIITLDKGEPKHIQLLDDDEFVINRNRLDHHLRDPEIFPLEQLIKAFDSYTNRLGDYMNYCINKR
ncbi:KilA-N domain-containing protein [Vibrio metschnikovii]|nr:KilA-N domain-containing protein [Vibrio metschnikovii]